MRFHDLLAQTEHSAEDQQRRASEWFPTVLASHGISLWRPGDPFPPIGVRYLLGVAARYSIPDLDLLDELDAKRRQGSLSAHRDVFDTSLLQKMDEFEEYIPGIAPVVQTPVLGVWVDGILRERLQGLRARNRVLR